MADTVLVTGGTGFIAGWCIVELLRRGHAVRATLRDPAREAQIRASVAPFAKGGGSLSFAVADLLRDDGWDRAMAGCDAVLHVASPLGRNAPRDRDALVAPARDGTLRVLRSAAAAGVPRVVMTSAAATARPPRGSRQASDETVWADPEDPLLDPYRRSKILAERAAWDFMATISGTTTLTTILPGAVFGPLLAHGDPASVWVIQGLLNGRPSRLLNLGLAVVDVRDLARLHVDAMVSAQAASERFLATGEFMWMTQIADILRSGLGQAGRRVPTRTLPDPLVRVASWFAPQLRMFLPDLGQRRDVDTVKARERLAFARRAAESTILDCARSLIDRAGR